MIAFLRYIFSWILYMGSWGSGVVGAALLGVRHRPGGIYDRSGREWGKGMLRGCRIAVRVEGRERLDPAAPAVYISNHCSEIDIWALLAELPGSVRFVYKKGMDWIPLMGLAMRRAKHIPIKRQVKSLAFSAYEDAAIMIRSGISAVVFAEGTRSRDGRLQPFKRGPFVLAIAAQVPVVPVLCGGTFDLMPKGSWRPRPGTVTIRIGEPIPTTGMNYDDRGRLADLTRKQLLAMGARE
ncbi:MAG TPA: lysophospholipid acyltransferase family protein [Gemmatimonadales bacterium]|nr:lysophospholipid acyltransferase family protein [Gemmatimonadales bacterium]